MKRISFLLAFIFILSFSYLNSQTLFVPGGFSTSGLGSSSKSGNVGIGTPNPSFRCDLNLGTVTSNSNIGFNVFGDATGNIGYSGYNLQLNNSTANASGYLRLARTASTAFLGLELGSQSRDGIRFLTHATSPVEVMRIDATGNVGIGVGETSPYSRLKVSYLGGPDQLIFHSLQSSNVYAAGLFENNGGSGAGLIIKAGAGGANYTLFNAMTWSGVSRFLIRGDGNVGIGTPDPQNSLSLKGELGIYGSGLDGSIFQRTVIYSNSYSGLYFDAPLNSSGNGLPINFAWRGGSPKITFLASGNVLIGKTTQTNTTYKLDVEGPIRAHEIVVNTTGADFVFEPTYKLRPLGELETFIKEHKHLPDIAPAKEMQESGVSAGEMQTKLLQKVEELTLYVIEQQKEIEKLKQQNAHPQNEKDDLSEIGEQNKKIAAQDYKIREQENKIEAIIEALQ